MCGRRHADNFPAESLLFNKRQEEQGGVRIFKTGEQEEQEVKRGSSNIFQTGEQEGGCGMREKGN